MGDRQGPVRAFVNLGAAINRDVILVIRLIGRTPRSIGHLYQGLRFIREVFGRPREARPRGFAPTFFLICPWRCEFARGWHRLLEMQFSGDSTCLKV